MKLSQVLSKAISIVVLTDYVNILQTRLKVFGFKNDPAVSLLPSFLPHFFSFCWASSRLHFGGKSFRETFWDLRIKRRER